MEMQDLIPLTGTDGYVGGRLLKSLERENLPVRCIVRRPEFLRARVSLGSEVVAGDLLKADSLVRASAGRPGGIMETGFGLSAAGLIRLRAVGHAAGAPGQSAVESGRHHRLPAHGGLR